MFDVTFKILRAFTFNFKSVFIRARFCCLLKTNNSLKGPEFIDIIKIILIHKLVIWLLTLNFMLSNPILILL